MLEEERHRRRITAYTTLRLSLYFGNSAEFCLNIQTHYGWDFDSAEECNDKNSGTVTIHFPTKSWQKFSNNGTGAASDSDLIMSIPTQGCSPDGIFMNLPLDTAGVVAQKAKITYQSPGGRKLQQALKSAPDTTVIEYHGQSKTKAQLRSAWQAKFKSIDPTEAKQLAAGRQAEFQAAAKALQDQQDQAIAKQNAGVTKEFQDLMSR